MSYNQDFRWVAFDAANFLEKRIKRGCAPNTRGTRKFTAAWDASSWSCVANGITATNSINRIVEDCECDLRRVKRTIWALQKEGNK